jgi:FtsZ-binding cell division protein ZapB
MKILLKLSVICFISVISVFAQTGSINNTLGTGGSFYVKDGTSDFFRVDQLTGNSIFLRSIELGNQDNSTQSIGLITKNGIRFIHNSKAVTSDGYNTFVGLYAGNFFNYFSTETYWGSYNTAVGFGSLAALTWGYSNSAVGWGSLTSNDEGYQNSAFGDGTLYSNTTGHSNSAFGYHALFSNDYPSENSAFGAEALNFNNGYENSAFGYRSLYSNTNGTQNSAVGNKSLYSNAGGYNNSAFGYQSLYSNIAGFNNSAFGVNSLYNNTGTGNTALGTNAGVNVTTGSNLTLIGYNAQPSSGSAFSEITLGDNQVFTLRCNVQTITSLSDARDKKNVKDLSLGLDFLMKVKPREFNWDRREWYENSISDGSKIQDHPTAGFIAQEFDSLQKTEHAEWLNLVLKNNPDKLEATYSNLLPVIVKAIQELKSKNDQLKSEVESLKSVREQLAEIESLKEELSDQIKTLKANSESTSVKFSSIED